MADRMSAKAKATVLQQVQKLIEDELGYKVELDDGRGARFNRLNLQDLSDAYIELEDINLSGTWSYTTKYTGDVKVIVTNGAYERGRKFKKWMVNSELNFEQGSAHKKTAQFLAKVKELVERETAIDQHKTDSEVKRKSEHAILTKWIGAPGMPIGYTLVDRRQKFVLVMDAHGGGSSDQFRVLISVHNAV